MLEGRKIAIIAFLLLAASTLVALRLHLEKWDRDNMHAWVIETMPYTISSDLSQQVLSYFRDKNGSKDRRTVEDFIAHLYWKDRRFTCVKPIEEDLEFVIAFNIMLPDNLESSNPFLFSFAHVVSDNSKDRYALFFHNKKLAIIKLSESELLSLVGETVLSEDPDVYYSR